MPSKPVDLPEDLASAYLALLSEREVLQAERDVVVAERDRAVAQAAKAQALLSDSEVLIASLELAIEKLKRELRGQRSEREPLGGAEDVRGAGDADGAPLAPRRERDRGLRLLDRRRQRLVDRLERRVRARRARGDARERVLQPLLLDARRDVLLAVLPGADTVIGHAMSFHAAPGSPVEIAVVVADEWQGLGYGSRLVGALLGRAAARGARTVGMDVLGDNRRVLAMIRRRWPQATTRVASGTVEIETSF